MLHRGLHDPRASTTASSASTARPRAHPARVGPAHHDAAHHPGRRSRSSPASPTCPTPASLVASPTAGAALRALRRADQRGTSRRRRRIGPSSSTPSSRRWIAIVLAGARRPGCSASPTSGTGKGKGPHGLTERNKRWPAPATRSSRTSTTSTTSTPTSSSAHQGPDRPGRQLVQPERHRRHRQLVGHGARRAPAVGLREHRPGRRRRHRQRLGRRLRGQRASCLRKIQTGKVQQYAALLFGAATVLAAVFVVIVSAS